MSFYGNVFQELTNAFSAFVIQSKFDDATAQTLLEAAGIGGKFTFAPGDEWIELGADSENYICTIKHSPIDSTRDKEAVQTLAKVSAAAGTPTVLAAGDILAVPTLHYDNAGHVVKSDILSYFKLPMSETETNIEDLQTRMTTLEDAEDAQNERLSALESTVGNYDSQIESLEERLGTVETLTPRVETLETLTSDMEALLGPRDVMTKNADLAVTNIIGNFDSMNEQIKYNTISDGLVDIVARINGSNSSISNNALATKVAFNKLCEALQAEGISIDPESLWQV